MLGKHLELRKSPEIHWQTDTNIYKQCRERKKYMDGMYEARLHNIV